MEASKVIEILRQIATEKSKTKSGWTHPDCVALNTAIRIMKAVGEINA